MAAIDRAVAMAVAVAMVVAMTLMAVDVAQSTQLSGFTIWTTQGCPDPSSATMFLSDDCGCTNIEDPILAYEFNAGDTPILLYNNYNCDEKSLQSHFIATTQSGCSPVGWRAFQFQCLA